MSKKKVISLFSGCGGMDLGLEGGFDVLSNSVNLRVNPHWNIKKAKKDNWVTLPKTGFKTVFSNDILKAARASWIPYFQKRGNNPDDFHLESIVDFVKAVKSGEKNFPENVDIVTGGFPCQDFSVAGKRKGFSSSKGHDGSRHEKDTPSEETRGMLYWWMREVISIVKPKVFIAENVKGLASLKDAKSIIENDFRTVGGGYTVVEAQILNSAHYGVPQTRQRVIFIGFKTDLLTESAKKSLSKDIIPESYNPYPKKTHKWQEKVIEPDLMPAVTAIEALKDLPEPEDSSDLSHQSYSKAKWMGKHCQGQVEIKTNAPGPTIRAEHHGNIEFRRLSKENGGNIIKELLAGKPQRRLTVRECARIQTFPDNMEFVRKSADPSMKISASEGYKVIGNAVPPLLAYHIAMNLNDKWQTYFGEN